MNVRQRKKGDRVNVLNGVLSFINTGTGLRVVRHPKEITYHEHKASLLLDRSQFETCGNTFHLLDAVRIDWGTLCEQCPYGDGLEESLTNNLGREICRITGFVEVPGIIGKTPGKCGCRKTFCVLSWERWLSPDQDGNWIVTNPQFGSTMKILLFPPEFLEIVDLDEK